MLAGYQSKSISWKYFMVHEMTLKLYFMKYSERKISQCILPLIDWLSNIFFTILIAIANVYIHLSFLLMTIQTSIERDT